MIYYMTETSVANSYKEKIDAVINSKDLANAKRIASRKQFFKGTVLNLYLDRGQKHLVSRKINGVWCDKEIKNEPRF